LNTRLTSLLVTAIAVAIAAFVAGCGSDSNGQQASGTQSGSAATQGGDGSEAHSDGSQAQSDETEGSSSAPGNAELIKKAGAACTQARESAFRRIAAYRNRHRSDGLPETVLAENAARAALLSTIDAEIAAIRATAASVGGEETIEAIVAEMQKTLDEARAMKEASSAEIEDLFADTDDKLEAYGLTACSKSA
jgi:hypothetical protein